MHREAKIRVAIGLLMFVVSGSIYFTTMAPDVYVSDFAEFQYLPTKLGIAHPNGFPFFTLLAWLWSHLPFGTVAWRMNLFAVLTGACAVGISSAFSHHVSGKTTVAVVTGLLLVVTPTLWKYSVAAERYGLNIFLVCCAFWTGWQAGQGGKRVSLYLVLSSLFFSLALATHPSVAVVGPIWLIYLIIEVPSLRNSIRPWLFMALVAIFPLLLYLYIPWRWAAFFDAPVLQEFGIPKPVFQGLVPAMYQDQLSLKIIWDYLTFGTQMVTGGRYEFWQRLSGSIVRWWTNEFSLWIVVLFILGLIRMHHRRERLGLLHIGLVVVLSITVASTTQAKTDAYLLLAFWSVIIVAGFSLDGVWFEKSQLGNRWIARLIKIIPILIILALVMWRVVQLQPVYDLSRYTENRRDWDAILAHPLEQKAALLADWSDLTPFWYIQQIDQNRLDLIGLFPPQPQRIIAPWVNAGNPLYLSAPLQHGYAPDLGKDYHLMPWGKLIKIQQRDADPSCPSFPNRQMDTPKEWPYDVLGWTTRFHEGIGGRDVYLIFCWQARVPLNKQDFVKLEFLSNEDEDYTSVNQPLFVSWFPESEIHAGDIGVAFVPLHLKSGVEAGEYLLRLNAFRLQKDDTWYSTDGGVPLVFGTISTSPETEFTASQLQDEFLPLFSPHVGSLALRAWFVSNEPIRPGDPIEVELLWQIRKPLEPVEINFRFWNESGTEAVDSLTTLLNQEQTEGVIDRVVRTTHIINSPRGSKDTIYLLEPEIFQNGERIPWRFTNRMFLGHVRVEDREHVYTLPADLVDTKVGFSNIAELAGYSVQLQDACVDNNINVSLYWRSGISQTQSFKVFVHLTDDKGEIVTQHDGIPVNGELPTDLWVEKEIIEDVHTLVLPSQLGPGSYKLIVGLYDSHTGERLALNGQYDNPHRAFEIRIDIATLSAHAPCQ